MGLIARRPKRTQRIARGRRIAQLLQGSWHCTPKLSSLSETELAEVDSLLLASGAGGLAWRQLRHSDLQASHIALQFREAWRLHTLQAAIHERGLKQIIPLLRSAGVEPVLVKGWSIARHYPEPGLRPYGDFDLCILPDQYETAQTVLKSPDARGMTVDLHLGFGKFCEPQTENIFARSQLVDLDGLKVRVLTEEDHLRFLCVHLLRHGAVRPLWLCDIALALERRAGDFDWDVCLGPSPRQADWVISTIGLAQNLLDARINDPSIIRLVNKQPSWVVPVTLKAWGHPMPHLSPIACFFRNPKRLFGELLRHWPNPIEATISMNGPFNEIPRLFFQASNVCSRTTTFLSQLTRG